MKDHKYVGQIVLVRSYASGVHVGRLESCEGKECYLADSRRIWSWSGAFTLSAVSQDGVKTARMSRPVPTIYIPDVCEITPCSKKAGDQLLSLPNHQI